MDIPHANVKVKQVIPQQSKGNENADELNRMNEQRDTNDTQKSNILDEKESNENLDKLPCKESLTSLDNENPSKPFIQKIKKFIKNLFLFLLLISSAIYLFLICMYCDFSIFKTIIILICSYIFAFYFQFFVYDLLKIKKYKKNLKTLPLSREKIKENNIKTPSDYAEYLHKILCGFMPNTEIMSKILITSYFYFSQNFESFENIDDAKTTKKTKRTDNFLRKNLFISSFDNYEKYFDLFSDNSSKKSEVSQEYLNFIGTPVKIKKIRSSELLCYEIFKNTWLEEGMDVTKSEEVLKSTSINTRAIIKNFALSLISSIILIIMIVLF